MQLLSLALVTSNLFQSSKDFYSFFIASSNLYVMPNRYDDYATFHDKQYAQQAIPLSLFFSKAGMILFQCFTQELPVKMRINFGGGNAFVPQHFLHGP